MSHYYIIRDGVVERYKQYTANGKERQRIDKKKALEDGAFPSVTTILKSIGDSQGLIEWSISTALGVALPMVYRTARSTPAMIPEDEEKFIEIACTEAREAADAALKDAANAGTAIHAAIEDTLKGAISTAVLDGPALVAALYALEYVANDGELHVEMPVAGESHGVKYGGTADVITKTKIIDWKTVPGGGRDPRISECAQLCALRRCIPGGENLSIECVYINRETGSAFSVKRWSQDEIALGEQWWEAACRAWLVMERWQEMKK